MFHYTTCYHQDWQYSQMRIKTYLKLLKILEGQLMRLSWHDLLVIIKETPINFETPFLMITAGF